MPYGPSGRKQNLTYNFLGNVTQVQVKNSGGTVTETQTMTYDAYGRETATSSSQYSASTAKTYTDRGQLATESIAYSGRTYTVTYHYDAQGRPTKLTYPSGREAEYTYDDRQLLKTIKWEGAQVEDRSYNDAGMLTGVDRAFVDETRTYNAGSQLTQINNTNVGSQTYTYDQNGNVTSESLSGVMANYSFSTIHAGGPFADGYDAEDRFMRFKRSGVTEDILLTRSNIGNISNVNRNGNNTARGYNSAHGLTTVTGGTTQTYDTDGNTTKLHTNVNAAWDDAGRMKNTDVPAGASAGIQGFNEYGYVGGTRVWKKITRSGSVVEHRVHIHAGPNLIAEYNAGVAASTPVQEYVYAGEIDSLVLIRRSDATRYGVTRNRQWSITALHDLANGNVVERYAYEMTGKRTIYAANGTTVRTTSSFGNNFGYTSRWHDEESGLMYFRARYYNPLTGEFLSRDPMEFVDGMSLYRGYMDISVVDPTGNWVNVRGTIWRAEREDTFESLRDLVAPALNDGGTHCIRPIVPGGVPCPTCQYDYNRYITEIEAEMRAAWKQRLPAECGEYDVANITDKRPDPGAVLIALSDPNDLIIALAADNYGVPAGNRFTTAKSVAEYIRDVASQGGSPISSLTILGHADRGAARIGGRMLASQFDTGDLVRVDQKRAIYWAEFDDAAQWKLSPVCWFRTDSESRFTGCKSLTLALRFTDALLRTGASGYGSKKVIYPGQGTFWFDGEPQTVYDNLDEFHKAKQWTKYDGKN
jgi:RHS repeat-associated protein